MPIVDDLQLPIRRTKMSGPGVDGINKRKEANSNEQVTATELLAGFNRIKEGLFSALRALIRPGEKAK
jgi:hypothetical protein